MIKKLRLRYLITNMALLSGTLLIFLGVLFGFLYHSEVNASYRVMQKMLDEANLPSQFRDTPSPTGRTTQTKPELMLCADSEPGVILLGEGDQGSTPWYAQWGQQQSQEAEQKDDQQTPQQTMPWGYNPWIYNPWIYNPWAYNPWAYNPWVNSPGYNPDAADPWKKDQSQQEEQNPQGGQQQWGWWVQTPQKDNDDSSVQQMPQQRDEPQLGAKPYQPSSDRQGDDRQDAPSETTRSQAPKSFFTTTEPVSEHPDPAGQDDDPYSEMPDAYDPDDAYDPQEISPYAGVVTSLPKPQTTEPQTETTAAAVVPVKEGHFVPNALLAQMDVDGNLISYAGLNANPNWDESFEIVKSAINQMSIKGNQFGTMQIFNSEYRFMTSMGSGGSNLILLDRSPERATINKLVFIFLLIGIVGLLIMFCISWLLAKWTVTPIATAWEKQKQFVADASHELKTPLAVISANTEVIMSDPGASVSGQSKWLNYIQSETMRMSKLISNLLSIARMDHASNTKAQGTVMSLSDTVSNICLSFEPVIYEKGKTLNTVIQRKVMLRAEEDDVKQLLSILLDNAVVHSVPKALITVSLSKDAQGKIRLAVSNTAKDIPPEQLSHLFDRFYRVDTEGSPNGSGLGLSIAKSIVNQMGGKISVSSENQLVTFTAVFST